MLPGGIWLDVNAPVFNRSDRALLEPDGRVIVLDASWARVRPLSQRLRIAPQATVERRALPTSLVTAYPRTSKIHEDPTGGLATVEAVFAVTVLLGEPRLEILEAYRWAREFLACNKSAFRHMGWEVPGNST